MLKTDALAFHVEAGAFGYRSYDQSEDGTTSIRLKAAGRVVAGRHQLSAESEGWSVAADGVAVGGGGVRADELGADGRSAAVVSAG